MVLLKVDVSALMGYTGAIFKQIFGSQIGLDNINGITIDMDCDTNVDFFAKI